MSTSTIRPAVGTLPSRSRAERSARSRGTERHSSLLMLGMLALLVYFLLPLFW